MSDIFTRSGTTFTNDAGNGATLVLLGSGNYLYTSRDGTKVEFLGTPFDTQDFPCPGSATNSCRIPLYILRPSGMKFTYTWNTVAGGYKQLAGVASSAGYSFSITYAGDKVVTFNNSVQPVSPQPTIIYSKTTHNTIVDTLGRKWAWQANTKVGKKPPD